LKDGDQVIITDHVYPAVSNTVRRACDAAGARLVIFPIPLPLPSPDEIFGSLVTLLGPRARMLVIEHVTSPTAAIFPVERIVSECRARGILTIVDAAHAPGMLPLDLRALGADVWTGNFHKWVCAPKGSAALVVSEEHRASMRPLITSQPWLESFTQTFAWTGTHDPTAYLSTPAAIDFLGSFGWDQVRARNHQLTTDARAVVADAIGAERLVDDAATGWMSIVPLPPGVATTREEARALQAALYDGHRIEVPIVAWNGRGLVRLSAHLYNRIEHYHALAEALRHLP
jgi:isopenicillin-N epimerase